MLQSLAIVGILCLLAKLLPLIFTIFLIAIGATVYFLVNLKER